MNTAGGASIGGFANFTRWYVRNGQMDKAQMMTLFGTTDACKSFPSGHTCAAGMSYGLIMLADSLGIKSKGKRAALWICPILFTGIVAVSRMVSALTSSATCLWAVLFLSSRLCFSAKYSF